MEQVNGKKKISGKDAIAKSKSLIKVADSMDDLILYPEIIAHDKTTLKNLQHFIKTPDTDLSKRAMIGFSHLKTLNIPQGHGPLLRLEIDNESFMLLMVFGK